MQVRESRNLVEVPKIGVPFSVDGGLHAEEAQRRHIQWADEYGVFRSEGEQRRFGAMDIGALAALLYPEASSPKDGQLVADWCAWLLLRDDRWDATEDPKEWERLAGRDRAYLRLMRQGLGKETAAHPAGEACAEDDGLYEALADLCTRLRKRAFREGVPDPVDRRLVGVMKGFFFSSVRETAYQHRGDYPTVSEYVKMRSVTGGLDILTFVLAALDGVRLPKGLLDDPAIRRLTDASHNVCCWHNDLVSLNKELASGEVHNLILVLQNDPDYEYQSLSEALDAA
ncbi:MAG: terpene synthase family protein, partial [Rubrobacteraceae bacterium]